jgi:RNA polymerase sigma-70 factor (ECF subfamily)
MPATEAELMQRYCAGEAAAFHELYARVAQRLLAYLIGLSGERATAEDLLQQSFFKLHLHRDRYVAGADPVPWIYTIAHRTFLDEARRRRRARVVPSGAEPPPEPRATIEGAPEGEPELDRPLDEQLVQALQQLPEPLREAVVLTKLHGRSHREAAAIAGATPTAIKLRAHRGYQALRRLLGRERS